MMTEALLPIIVKELSPKEHESVLIRQFARMVVLNMAFNEYSSFLNQEKEPLSPEMTQALEHTAFLTHQATFSAFTDIKDYGSTTLVRQAVEMIQICQEIREGRSKEMIVKERTEEALNEIGKFVKGLLEASSAKSSPSRRV